MSDDARGRVKFNPGELARRQEMAWPGMTGEIVRIMRSQSYDYGAKSRFHVFAINDRVVRAKGETRIEGLPPSTRHDLSHMMCIVPAGRAFTGWDVPRSLPSTTYFYIDSTGLLIDDELGFNRIDLKPRLFFHDPALWSTAQKLKNLIENPQIGSRLYAEALIAVLVIELMRLQEGTVAASAPARGGLAGWQLRIVCEQIEGNLGSDVSLEELARSVRLSPWHFCRSFKQSTGLAPHRFQMQRRVERAKMMLADHKRSVTDVALACGFAGSSNFASTFRKLTGCAPREYRKSLC